MRNQMDLPQNRIDYHDPQMDESDDLTSQPETESDNAFEDSKTDSESEEQTPPVHVLALLRRRTIQFSKFCESDGKWETSTGQINVAHSIDSCRDAIMIPVGNRIVIFHMQNGSIARAEYLTLGTKTLEKITLPCNVELTNFALFCHMNDVIYCFARADQQYFHG